VWGEEKEKQIARILPHIKKMSDFKNVYSGHFYVILIIIIIYL